MTLMMKEEPKRGNAASPAIGVSNRDNRGRDLKLAGELRATRNKLP